MTCEWGLPMLLFKRILDLPNILDNWNLTGRSADLWEYSRHKLAIVPETVGLKKFQLSLKSARRGFKI